VAHHRVFSRLSSLFLCSRALPLACRKSLPHASVNMHSSTHFFLKMVFNYIYTIVLVSIESVVTENCRRNRNCRRNGNRKQKTENCIFLYWNSLSCALLKMYIICVGGEEVRTVLARNVCECVILVCESVFVCVCSEIEEGFVALDCVQRLMCMSV